MYIKLIQPRMRKRPMDTDIKLHMAPPLGLLTIAGLLRKDHRVVIENENVEDLCFDDHPDLVGITVTVDAFPRAVEIARRFRAAGSLVVAGGIHVTTAAFAIPDGCFDALCIGAAEGTWPRIVADAQAGRLQPVYRCSPDLRGDQLASPAYDLLKQGPYLYCNVVHTSRGCPFRCDFCYNSASTRRYVNRTVEAVLSDIRAVNCKHVMFIDDNFAGNPQWTRTLLKELKPLKLKWNAAVSINVVNDLTLLDEMRESGCQSLFIGFESIHPESLENVHKVQNNTVFYEAAVQAIHDRGIMINGSFVFGLDGDTPETFRLTRDWIVRNRIETVTSHILTPYPGTVLYDRLESEGRITCRDLSRYNTANVVFQPKGMTAEELYQGYLWMYRELYSTKNILRRLPKAREQVLPYLLFNFLYRKFGPFTDALCRNVTYARIGRLADRLARYL